MLLDGSDSWHPRLLLEYAQACTHPRRLGLGALFVALVWLVSPVNNKGGWLHRDKFVKHASVALINLKLLLFTSYLI